MAQMLQVGVIGIRDPVNPERIVENVPIYEEIDGGVEQEDADGYADIGKQLARLMHQYIQGGGLNPQP